MGWHGPKGVQPNAEERPGKAALKWERLVRWQDKASDPACH